MRGSHPAGGTTAALSLTLAAVWLLGGSVAQAEPAGVQRIAAKLFAVHDKGRQWLGMANTGELSNPDNVQTLPIPRLEYPGGSHNVFLVLGGLWVGARLNGVPRVSTASDGDNGTNEFAGLEFATPADISRGVSVGWLEKGKVGFTSDERGEARLLGRYLGIGEARADDDGDWTTSDDVNRDTVPSFDFDGVAGVDDDGDEAVDEETLNGSDDDGDGLIDEDVGVIDQTWTGEHCGLLPYVNDDPARITPGDANGDGDQVYDPEPAIDEDWAGDASCDYVDNDFDGLVDELDPDRDGDRAPGSLDDDGDGVDDEDDCAKATHELITAYVDTCVTCVDHPDSDGVAPLGVRVVQHSYQWVDHWADDFLAFEYQVANVGGRQLDAVCLAPFLEVLIDNEHDHYPCIQEASYFVDSLQLAVTVSVSGSPSLTARYVGVMPLACPTEDATAAFLTFNRMMFNQPITDSLKYDSIASDIVDPATGPVCYEQDVVMSFGSLGSLNRGETALLTIAIVNGIEETDLILHATQARRMMEAGFWDALVPPIPYFTVGPLDRGALVRWKANAEGQYEPMSGYADFQGYRVWRTQDGQSWTLARAYDLPDSIGQNAGWPPPESTDERYAYEFKDSGLSSGIPMSYVVTAFDDGNNGDGIHTAAWDERNGGVGVLESPRTLEQTHQVHTIGPASSAGSVTGAYVVPNPYRGSSSMLGPPWTPGGSVGEVERHIEFRGLPGTCSIQLYTLAGDLVRELHHTNGLSWQPWNLHNEEGREVAGGIYLYRVSSGGSEAIGKFVIVR